MASIPYKFTTTASTNLQNVRAGQAANVTAISVANVATAIYIKLFWMKAGGSPTVGTTVPDFTMGVAASANLTQYFGSMTDNGQLWVAVTAAAADGDSANAASGAVVTLLVE